MSLANKRFISNEGPDQTPYDAHGDVRFLMSTATHPDALIEKSRIDSTPSTDRTTVIFQSGMREGVRWTCLVPDGTAPDPRPSISFDIFSVPRALLAPGSDLGGKVIALLREFGQQGDPGNVG